MFIPRLSDLNFIAQFWHSLVLASPPQDAVINSLNMFQTLFASVVACMAGIAAGKSESIDPSLSASSSPSVQFAVTPAMLPSVCRLLCVLQLNLFSAVAQVRVMTSLQMHYILRLF
jgi:hypothetical protein